MTRIRQIIADLICVNLFHQRYPRAISLQNILLTDPTTFPLSTSFFEKEIKEWGHSFDSTKIVTGPSLNIFMSIIAPNIPDLTLSFPRLLFIRAINFSYIASATS